MNQNTQDITALEAARRDCAEEIRQIADLGQYEADGGWEVAGHEWALPVFVAGSDPEADTEKYILRVTFEPGSNKLASTSFRGEPTWPYVAGSDGYPPAGLIWMAGPKKAVLNNAFSYGPDPDRTFILQMADIGEYLVGKNRRGDVVSEGKILVNGLVDWTISPRDAEDVSPQDDPEP